MDKPTVWGEKTSGESTRGLPATGRNPPSSPPDRAHDPWTRVNEFDFRCIAFVYIDPWCDERGRRRKYEIKSLAAISIERKGGEERIWKISNYLLVTLSSFESSVHVRYQCRYQFSERERELRLRFVDVGGKEKIWENIGLVQLRLWVRFIRKLRPLLNDVNRNRN